MAKLKFGKNTLPLLAITALFLSVALVNYDQSIVSNSKNTQSVLSKSDENNEEEDRSGEDKKEEERKEVKVETVTRSRETEKIEKREIKKETKSLNTKPETIKVEEEIEIEEEDVNDEQSDESIDNEVETEFEQESETASSDGTINRFKLKVKTKTIAGKTVVQTNSGEVEVENSPEDAINSLVEEGLIDDPISFEAKVNNREKVEFEIQGTDSKRFLGIFNVVIPKTLTVSSETGEVVSTSQNVWSRVLSLLSI